MNKIIRRLSNIRIGFRLSHKITALGAIGIIGLVLIGGNYLADVSYRNTYKKIQQGARAMEARVGTLNVLFLESRRAEKNFLLRHDMKYAKRHAELSKTIIQEIGKLRQQASATDHARLAGEVEQIGKGIKAYVAAFTDLTQAGRYLGLDEKSGLRGALGDAAHAMVTTFDKLDQPRLLAGMLMMRQIEKDFTLRPDAKYGDVMEKRAAEFGAKLAKSDISDDAKNDIQQKLDEYQSQFSAYTQGAISLKDAEKAASDAYAAVEPVINAATKHIGEITANAATAAAKAEASTRTRMEITFLVILLAIAAFGFVVSRSVSKPLHALTKGMLELANGNFDVALPGLERKDEVGDIAGAVETFKLKAAEKARHEAEQKTEQDKRAAAERDAAMQKMADEFEAAIGDIVKAASAGDFSQRVDLTGKSGLVLHIGSAINALCENVAKALDDLIQMLNALAEGDLTKRITAEYQGNFALLKNNANDTAERISATISDIKAAAREITNASIEISTSTTDLSQRTEEQAASLEETAASMEQIAATVKTNAENAHVAKQSAASTREVADRGGEVVARTVEAMARIEESSGKIADIISVIDEIARQTNLLALNAAVEAARAGETGRGFAVVASEVRSLAQRAAQAAKDIKDLITNSKGQVTEGVKLVNRAGASLTEIVESIKNVADIVSEIANASAEQSSGIDQINKALTQMDEMTQQNTALVEENAATTKTLERQASAMDERIAFFRLDQAAFGRAIRTATSAAASSNQADVVALSAHKASTASKPTPKPVPRRQGAHERSWR